MFYCNTLNQYRIGAWLMAQGITDEEITTATMWDEDTVEICCMSGFSLNIRWTKDGPAIIKSEDLLKDSPTPLCQEGTETLPPA